MSEYKPATQKKDHQHSDDTQSSQKVRPTVHASNSHRAAAVANKRNGSVPSRSRKNCAHVLLPDVQAIVPKETPADPVRVQAVSQQFDQVRTVHIRDDYMCASLAESKELLQEALDILNVFATIENVHAPVGTSGNADPGNLSCARDAFIGHPMISALTKNDEDPQASVKGRPDYRDVASMVSVDVRESDGEGLAELNRDLLQSYFPGHGSNKYAGDLRVEDIRMAVARALLTAASSALTTAVDYLMRTFNVDTVLAFVASLSETDTQTINEKSLFELAVAIENLSRQVPRILATGHSALSVGHGLDFVNTRPGTIVDIIQNAPPLAPQAEMFGRRDAMISLLQGQDVPGYVSVFYENAAGYGPTDSLIPDFQFATLGSDSVSRVLGMLNASHRLVSTERRLKHYRVVRAAHAAKEEDERKRALDISIVDPNQPLTISALATTLSYLANEPGEAGTLSVDCALKAQIKLLQAGLGGTVSFACRMFDSGQVALSFDASVAARLGVGMADAASGGVSGTATTAYSYRFENHDKAARGLFGLLREWVEDKGLQRYTFLEGMEDIDPGKEGIFVAESKRALSVDASGKLGDTSLAGSVGKTWVDRRMVDTDGKEREMGLSFTEGAFAASASVGNVGVSLDTSANLIEIFEADKAPTELLKLGGGIKLAFSGGVGKNAKKWERLYSQDTKNNVSKAVGKSLERLRLFLTGKYPSLARNPSFSRSAWKALRKDVIEKVNSSAKSAASPSMQFSLSAKMAREASGLDEQGELDTSNREFRLHYVRLLQTMSTKFSTGFDAKLLSVSTSASMGKLENVVEFLGDHTVAYCKALYKISGSTPGSPTGLWKTLLDGNRSEVYEVMWGAIWNAGAGPYGVGSAGADFEELFLQMKADEESEKGTVRSKISEQSADYLALLESGLERAKAGTQTPVVGDAGDVGVDVNPLDGVP